MMIIKITIAILTALLINGYFSALDTIFRGTSLLYLLFIAIILFWTPYSNKAEIVLKGKHYYRAIDCLDQSNPLYTRGFFRKNASGKMFLADLKGFLYCQIVSIFPIIATIAYACVKKLEIFECKEMEILLTWLLIALIIMRIVFWMYYARCYTKDFQYTENLEGRWMPFSNMARLKSKRSYRGFECFCDTEYLDLENNLISKCFEQNYIFDIEYNVQEEKLCFFSKKNKNSIHIFTIVHITQYTDKCIQRLNQYFSKYWSKYMKGVKNESVNLILFICVDTYTAELGERYWGTNKMYVDQKNKRYRLPIFWVNSERPFLKILGNYDETRGGQEYRKMRKEVLRMLALNEKY